MHITGAPAFWGPPPGVVSPSSFLCFRRLSELGKKSRERGKVWDERCCTYRLETGESRGLGECPREAPRGKCSVQWPPAPAPETWTQRRRQSQLGTAEGPNLSQRANRLDGRGRTPAPSFFQRVSSCGGRVLVRVSVCLLFLAGMTRSRSRRRCWWAGTSVRTQGQAPGCSTGPSSLTLDVPRSSQGQGQGPRTKNLVSSQLSSPHVTLPTCLPDAAALLRCIQP